MLDGRFELEERAAEGGMGAVHRARDRATGGVVAVKLLRRRTKSLMARFAREARVLAELRHPAVVRYVAHGQDQGEAFIAMEWLNGEDLAARLRRGPLGVGDALALVGTVAGPSQRCTPVASCTATSSRRTSSFATGCSSAFA